MKKILIDTDIGDDIDDALAIAYALNSHSLEVVGITTAFRCVELRTKMVAQMLRVFETPRIPIATGVGQPLLSPIDPEWIPPHWDPVLPWEESAMGNMDAVSFLIESARRYPGLVIAGIAPLTNLAMAARRAPEVMRDVELWLMGGIYTKSFPEWNFLCDPEAAQIVLTTYRHIHVVGLDVTLQCRLTQDQVEALAGEEDARTKLLYRWTKQWQAASQHPPILHDPLLVAAMETPELLTFEEKEIYVECGGSFSRGMTVEKCDPFFGKPQNPNVKMAVAVDVDRFQTVFCQTVFPSLSK